ncbi:hypothetical protein CN481_05055 [Bacillus sp. AFS006103]|nr:hypothetical protein CN481_05055 [Bacillus sp. AFS006103]
MNVLMIGAGRAVQGGVSTVVNQYYAAGLDQQINLKYIGTMEDGSKIKKAFIAAYSYIQFCSDVKSYDIVHVHMSSRASFYRKSLFIKKAYKAGKKIIIHMHGSEFDVFYDKECDDKQKQQVREVFAMSNAVIALSEEWKEYLSKICDESKIIILYNAVKMPNFQRKDYSDKAVLFLGRLGKRKGTYDLIEAIPKVLEIDKEICFYLGGDGDVEEFKRLCTEKGIQDNVTFLGWVTGDTKVDYLKKCSTFILPSYHEGMPMAILEAMSFGDVVISTYVGGIPKVIQNDRNGYLVKAGEVDEIVKAVLTAVNGNRKVEVGRQAYNTILQSFNIDKNVKNLIQLYHSII